MATRDEIIRLKFEALGIKDVDGLVAALGKLEDEAKQGDAAAKALVEQLDRLTETTRQAADFARLTASVEDLREEFDQANEKAYSLKAALQGTAEPTKEMKSAFASANKEVQRLGERLTQQERVLKATGDELERAGVDVRKLVTEEIRLRGEADKAAAAVASQVRSLDANREAARKNAAALDQLAASFEKARDRANDIASKITKAGAAAAAAATAFAAYKTGEFFVGAVESAAEFEASISQIAAVSGAAGDQLDMLRETARTAALDSGIAFGDVTATLGELARAVGDAEKAAAILGPTLNLATAGGLEAAKSAEILTTTLTQFGLEAENATRVADLLANGANATTASVEQLGNSLSYAAPLARQLGMSVDQTVAAIGALADEGFRGERAGTALRNVLSALSNPTSNLNSALDDLGIKTRNFNEVVVELAKRGEAGKQALLALDAEARPAMLALVNSGARNIDRLTQSFERMEVTAASAAAVMRDNLQGAANQAKVAFDALRQDLVEPLLEPLTDELKILAGELRAFASSPEFAQISDALKAMFVAGTEAGKEFLGTVDFVDLANKITAFADSAGSRLRNFGNEAQQTFALISDAVGVMNVAFQALQTGIFGIAAAIAKTSAVGAELAALQLKIYSLVPSINLAAKAIGIDLGGAVDELREKGGALDAVYQEFANRTVANANETADAIARIGGASDAAAASGARVGSEIAGGLEPLIPELQTVDATIRGLLPASRVAAEGYGVLRQEAQATQAVLSQSSAAAQEDTNKILENAFTAQDALLELQRQQLLLEQKLAEARATGASIAELRRYTEALEENRRKIVEVRELLGAPVPQNNALATSVEQISTAATSAKEAVEQTDAAAQSAGSAAGGYINALQAFITEFMGVSDAALQQFLKFQRGTVGVGTPLEKSAMKLLEAAAATRKAIGAQQDQAAILGQIFDDVGNAGENAAAVLTRVGMTGAGALDDFARAVRAGTTDINLLNQSDLDTLAASAERAAAKVRQIQAEAAEAKRELEEMAQSLQDSIDQRDGNLIDIERRRYEDELKRIDELAKKSGQAAAAQAAETRRLAEIEHQRRMAEIEAEAAAERKATDDTAAHIDRVRKQSGGSGAGGGGNAAAGLGDTQRVEVVMRNEQRPGSILAEMTEGDIEQIAQRVIAQINFSRMGAM